MRQNDCLKPGERAQRTEFGSQEYATAYRENIIELGHKARQEVECFINGHIDDSTKGWPILSRVPGKGMGPCLRKVS